MTRVYRTDVQEHAPKSLELLRLEAEAERLEARANDLEARRNMPSRVDDAEAKMRQRAQDAWKTPTSHSAPTPAAPLAKQPPIKGNERSDNAAAKAENAWKKPGELSK